MARKPVFTTEGVKVISRRCHGGEGWAMGSLETLLEGVDVKGANGSFICASNFLSIENICQPQQTSGKVHRGL